MPEQPPNQPKAERFKCPGCSADMEFDPSAGALKCPYCGVTQAVSTEAARPVQENSIDNIDPSRFGQLSPKALEVNCATCGSTMQFEPPDIAGTCPFCAAKIVVQPKSPDPLISPDGLLPFSVPRDRATAAFKQWISSLWFAPGDLTALAQPDGLKGVYLPFWTFDAEAYTSYRGQRGDAYYETEYVEVTDSEGRTRREARQVRRIRWSFASGSVENSFDDILVPSCTSVALKRLEALEPWDLPALTPYEPAYLAGFKAQRYQVELPDGFEKAKAAMQGPITNSIRHDIGGDEQRIDSTNTEYSEVTFKHLLLPVWLGAYRYQGKVFQVLVNARTAEVQGDRPYSAAKIVLAVAAAILIIIVLAVMFKK